MSQNDVMFNRMDSDIVNSFIKIGYFHTISILFYEAESSFNSRSKRFKFFIDQAMRHRWPFIFYIRLRSKYQKYSQIYISL